ncbi:MAG: Ferredoxin [Firmicutes bacterium ADurb.Bin419]|nr:MAG: Ferredoxin [Firmicutes bacterium ADurb.Bin419]
MVSVFDKKENCCGCTACKNICPKNVINMIPDSEGFLYPVIDQKLCIDCGLCRRVCPFLNKVFIQDKLTDRLIYAVKHKNMEVRKTSSSGGVYTAISDYILKESGIVYGVRFDDNFNVIHSKAITPEERDKFKGSKYIQSDLKDTFKQIKHDLEAGKKVLFTGTGCQVAGLRLYLSNAGTNTERLIANDIICHGTPSPLLWKNYLNFIQTESRLKEYSFRYKEKGWRGYNIRAEFKNGKVQLNTPKIKTFSMLFGSDLALRSSCYRCPFSNLNRPSDIMMGDFWGIEKTMPRLDDNRGISLLLINTEKGRLVLKGIEDEIDKWKSDSTACIQYNLEKPTREPKNREKFWQEFSKNSFSYIAKKYGGNNIKSVIKAIVRRILVKLKILQFLKK